VLASLADVVNDIIYTADPERSLWPTSKLD
jgi:hypothetical protein